MNATEQREHIRNWLISRIGERLDALKISERQASIRVDGNPETLRNVRRKSLPTADRLMRIAAALETSVAYLLSETDDPRQSRIYAALAEDQSDFEHAPAVPTVTFGDDTYIAIARWDLQYAAGIGEDQPGEPVVKDRLLFRREWLSRATAAPPHRLVALEVRGDSMAPNLMNGDTVLVDKDATDPARREGIYAINDDGAPLVKRIASAGPHMVNLLSDNPTYPAQPRARGDIDIVGRVVWMGRQL